MITLNYPVALEHIGKISQLYGEHPDWYVKYGFPGHNGIDWAIVNYTDILDTAPGIVTMITPVKADPNGYGLNIQITHEGTEGEKYTTIYAHLGNVKVTPGQEVEAGELIALSDNTGNSTGPHLHFGLRDMSRLSEPYRGWVDPMPYFRAIPAPAPPADVPELGVVMISNLNLRAGPSTNSAVIGSVGKGLVVQIYDQAEDDMGNLWYRVKISINNKVGWACGTYKSVYIRPIKSG